MEETVLRRAHGNLFLLYIFTLIAAVVTLASQAGALGAKPRNMLFIIADDLNLSLGSYGRPVPTPHLDQLASRSSW